MTISYKWSLEEEHLLKLLRPTNTYQEIEIEFQKRVDRNLPGFRCARSAEAVRKKCDRDNITPELCDIYTKDNVVERHWKQILDIVEIYKEDSVFRTRGIIPEDEITTKILSLSDIHFPLARVDLLLEIIDEHSDADILVVNGDLLEGYLFSTFEKHKTIAAIDEYQAGFNFIKLCSEIFPKVVITSGNHDKRASRALKSTSLPKEATQVLGSNLIARIANGEKLDTSGMLVKKYDFDNVIYQGSESWYVLIGKTLFIHPSARGGSKPGWMVQSWNQKFATRYLPGEYDSVVCGHSHQIYKGIINSTLLIEQGCLTDLLTYAWSPGKLYNTNGQSGYAVIYQDAEGNTCFNRSTPIFLGEILPPKKSAV